MKTTLYLVIYVAVCFFLFGCKSEKKSENDLIQINVSASYPEKEIKLEEVADIEYLQIGVYEDFLFAVDPAIITSDKIIFFHPNDGDVIVYSREGNPLFRFNRKGNGPGEHGSITQLIYDEITDEFFMKSFDKIIVYVAQGEFKRVIILPSAQYTAGSVVVRASSQITNFDSQTLLLFDPSNNYPFTLISKEDGTEVKVIDIPKDKEVNAYVMSMQMDNNNVIVGMTVLPAPTHHLVRHKDGYLLTEFSNDTVYFLSPDKKLSPFLVRQPAIQSMEPVITLNSLVEAGNYEFLLAVTIRDDNGALPRKYLMRDKKTGSIYRQKITFNDYRGKEVNLSTETIIMTQDSKLGLIVLSLTELQDANRENKLSGRLKELVENSDDDGNDIYMLLHFK